MAKPVNATGGGSVSSNDAKTSETKTPETKTQALTVTSDGDVSGPMRLALSQQMQDQLAMELQEALHQVEEGFGNLTSPTDIAAMGVPFFVVDAITIDDYLDKGKGEILTKHVFKLELEDGRILYAMQGDARPRRVFASVFQKARAGGMRVTAGPYLYEKKPIPGQPQAAWIFVQQPGFRAEVH